MESTIHSHSKVYNTPNTANDHRRSSTPTCRSNYNILIGLSMIHLVAPPSCHYCPAAKFWQPASHSLLDALQSMELRAAAAAASLPPPPPPVVSKTTTVLLEAGYTTRVRVESSIRRGTLGTWALAVVAQKLLRHTLTKVALRGIQWAGIAGANKEGNEGSVLYIQGYLFILMCVCVWVCQKLHFFFGSAFYCLRNSIDHPLPPGTTTPPSVAAEWIVGVLMRTLEGFRKEGRKEGSARLL